MHENCGKIKAQTRKFTWFRFYHEALNDPKIQMLEATTFKGWINCLCLAAQNDGAIPNVDRLAFALRLSPNSARDLLDALILAELIDIRPDGTMEPHNWTARQYKSDVSTERVKKHREKRETPSVAPDEAQCNVSSAVSVTPPETEAETEAEERTPLPPKRGAGPSPNDALAAFHAFNEVALRCGLQQAAKLTQDRQRKITARLKDYGLDGWHKAMANIAGSAFLKGKNERGWRATLDFVLQPASFSKLHDGAYNADEPKPAQTGPRSAVPLTYDTSSNAYKAQVDAMMAEFLRGSVVQ